MSCQKYDHRLSVYAEKADQNCRVLNTLFNWIFGGPGDQLTTAASLASMRRRVLILRRWVPPALAAVVVIYELGPSRWIHDRWGADLHFLAEILIYGTVGPLLTYFVLELLRRWLEARETGERQAAQLAHAREHAAVSRQLNDDAIQTLFAASAVLSAVEDSVPPELAAQLESTGEALDQAIRQLRAQLLRPPLPTEPPDDPSI